MLLILIAALPQDVEKQDGALPAFDEMVRQGVRHPPRAEAGALGRSPGCARTVAAGTGCRYPELADARG
jgi:hypothetical protein